MPLLQITLQVRRVVEVLSAPYISKARNGRCKKNHFFDYAYSAQWTYTDTKRKHINQQFYFRSVIHHLSSQMSLYPPIEINSHALEKKQNMQTVPVQRSASAA